MSQVKPTVLLADDYPGILEKLSQLLCLDFEIVGAVGNGAAAVECFSRLKPDIVLMDISMPGMDGLQAAREIRKMNIESKIVILSALNDQAFVTCAFESGCKGYVLKSRMS